MMNAVSAVADKLATTPRSTGEEPAKRIDTPKPVQPPAAETEASAVVEISSQGASLAGAPASDASSVSEFDEADANQDGSVNVLEQRAYDFMHPTLARYPGAPDETPAQKTVTVELKAYEAVARNGYDR
ncbi:hypothetical protein [Roseateles sp.]|uniref:hypothetical protein n=1 Tax=Roseateles sp. TaxID=1971397 RepID=UPI00286B59D0|nr:hypothetical protein [Roseateles sp.]